ncbi:putative ribonuclease H-like domain-containing protein [Tanacetum coccineum]
MILLSRLSKWRKTRAVDTPRIYRKALKIVNVKGILMLNQWNICYDGTDGVEQDDWSMDSLIAVKHVILGQRWTWLPSPKDETFLSISSTYKGWVDLSTARLNNAQNQYLPKMVIDLEVDMRQGQMSDFKSSRIGYVAFGNDLKGGEYQEKEPLTSCLDLRKLAMWKSLILISYLSLKSVIRNTNVLFTEIKNRKICLTALDLKNIIHISGDHLCLVAKATEDEAVLWHRRLGHVNFKNINKLVKGNLVRGLPSKTFKLDHSCLACRKGKQHRASCKKIEERTVREPLELLHMDLFGPVSVESINKKKYCLVVTDDCSKFSWVFFLAYKDETYDMLHDLIVGLENRLRHKVKTIRCDNGTEFKNQLMNEFCAKKGIKREYSIARTPQQNGVAERKNRTLIEAARTMLADSLLPIQFWAEAVNTACYFMRLVVALDYTNYSRSFGVTRKVQGCLHVNFLEIQVRIKRDKVMIGCFGLDLLTPSMNYIPVRTGKLYYVDDTPKDGVSLQTPFDAEKAEDTAGVQTRRKLQDSTSNQHQALLSFIYKQNRTNHKDQQTCLFACFLSQEEPKKVSQALADESWVEAMQEELLQFKLQERASMTAVINDVPHIRAKVAGKKILISEATIRADLLFDDENGVDCFPKQVIWDLLRDIGYEGNLAQLTFSKPLFSPQWKYLIHVLLHCLSPKSTSWEQFGTNIASALVGLATNQKFNFSLMIMNGMLGHISNGTPFLMYPRFVQLFLNKQLEGVDRPQDFIPSVSLPTKVFTFMRKHSTKFSCRITPLTPSMLEVVTALAAEEEHSTSPHSRAASSARDAQGSKLRSAVILNVNLLQYHGTARMMSSQTLEEIEGLWIYNALNREVRQAQEAKLFLKGKQIIKLKLSSRKTVQIRFLQLICGQASCFWGIESQNFRSKRDEDEALRRRECLHHLGRNKDEERDLENNCKVLLDWVLFLRDPKILKMKQGESKRFGFLGQYIFSTLKQPNQGGLLENSQAEWDCRRTEERKREKKGGELKEREAKRLSRKRKATIAEEQPS